MTRRRFGSFPPSVLDTAWCRSLPADVRVYLAICCWARSDWTSSITNQQIVEATGLKLRTVQRAKKKLLDEAVIRIARKGSGQGHANVYEIVSTVVTPFPAGERVSNRGLKGVKSGVKGVSTGDTHPDIHPDIHPDNREDERESAHDVVGDDSADPEEETRRRDVFELLTAEGIWAGRAAALARRHDLTRARAQAVIDQAETAAGKNRAAWIASVISRGGHVPCAKTPKELCDLVKAGVVTTINGRAVSGDQLKHNDAGLYVDGELLLATEAISGADLS